MTLYPSMGWFMKALAVLGFPVRGGSLPRVLAQSAVPASVTGTLSETVLATIPIPAGVMGPNGRIRITALWTMPNNANTKQPRIKIPGVANLYAVAFTTTAGLEVLIDLYNRNALNSQVGSPQSSSSGIGGSGLALVTSSADFSVAQSIQFTGQLGNVADTISLEAYTVEILNP